MVRARKQPSHARPFSVAGLKYSETEYKEILENFTRKAPLRNSLDEVGGKWAESSGLALLRTRLIEFWYRGAGSKLASAAAADAALPPKSFFPIPDTEIPPATQHPANTHTRVQTGSRAGVPVNSQTPLHAASSTGISLANAQAHAAVAARTNFPRTPNRIPDSSIDPVLLAMSHASAASAIINTAFTDAQQVEGIVASSDDTSIPAAILANAASNAQDAEDDDDDDSTFTPTAHRGPRGAQDATEDELLAEFGQHVPLEAIQALLAVPEDEDDGDEELEDEEANDGDFSDRERQLRVEVAENFEANRRAGGRKTQDSLVRDHQRFVAHALSSVPPLIKDKIIDAHHVLAYIKYTGEREKLTKKGVPIPHSYVGASHIKKCFFGVLRMRKLQVAEEQRLDLTRPCQGVLLMDSVNFYMTRAMDRDREGDVGDNDAPDIVANTMLSTVTDDMLDRVRFRFVKHRQVRQAVFGLLAWNWQFQSGNRGDDLRALKLCELQPFEWLHPDKHTLVTAILGCQGEGKVQRRGLQTTRNPRYRNFIAHRDPARCSFCAFAIYLHWLFDHFKLCDNFEIDWTLNKSWRKFRLLFGSDPQVAYSANAMYNLYAKTFKAVGLHSVMKQHFPRHMLAYQQERQGVDHVQTQQLGWTGENTFAKVYAVAIPKPAVLGCAGYKEHEVYDPAWRHIRVPEEFLGKMCPLAEEIIPTVKGQANKVGVTNFWEMVVWLRPYLFLGAAAIYQREPKATIFRLPAFSDPKIVDWMRDVYPQELAHVTTSRGLGPSDLAAINDRAMRQAFEAANACIQQQNTVITKLVSEMRDMRGTLERRTSVLSPNNGYAAIINARRVLEHAQARTSTPKTGPVQWAKPPSPLAIYTTSTANADPMHSTRVHVEVVGDGNEFRPSPLDLIWPNDNAFRKPGEPSGRRPLLLSRPGASTVSYTADIFPHITEYDTLYSDWGPAKTLDKYKSAWDIWELYAYGEPVHDKDGNQTGVKPPLRDLEEYFRAKWRAKDQQRRAWSRLLELVNAIQRNPGSPATAAKALDERRKMLGGLTPMGLYAFSSNVLKAEREALERTKKATASAGSSLLPAFGDDVPELSTVGSNVLAVATKRKPPLAPRGKAKKLRVS